MRFLFKPRPLSPVTQSSISLFDDAPLPTARFLRDVKTLGYANRRELLRDLAASATERSETEVLDSSCVPNEEHNFATPPKSTTWRWTHALFLLLLLATISLVYFLSSVGTFSAALLAVFVASTVSSTVGFAFSAVAAGMLLQIIGDQIAVVEIMLISSIALQVYCVAALWREIHMNRITWFLVGGIITLPIGVYLLLTFNTLMYAFIIGIFLSIYGVVTLIRPIMTVNWGGAFTDTIVGSTGGIIGPLVAFPGALVAIWCSVRGWDRTTQRSIYQPYILVMQVITLGILALLGETKRIDFTYGSFAIPAVLGAYIGFSIFERMTDGQFRTLVNVLLIASGVGILGRAFH